MVLKRKNHDYERYLCFRTLRNYMVLKHSNIGVIMMKSFRTLRNYMVLKPQCRVTMQSLVGLQ